MVSSALMIAALPLINALYIPHDFKGLNELAHAPAPSNAKGGASSSVPVHQAVIEALEEDDEEALFAAILDAPNLAPEDCAKGRHGGMGKHHGGMGKHHGGMGKHHGGMGKHHGSMGKHHKAKKSKNLKKDHKMKGKHHGKAHNKHTEVAADGNGDCDSETEEVTQKDSDEGLGAMFVPSDLESVIPDRYIVIFEPGVSLEEATLHLQTVVATAAEHVEFAENAQHPLNEFGGSVLDKVYNMEGFKGYAGAFLPSVAKAIAKLPGVAVVEPDTIVHALDHDTENSAPWGLARVSHRKSLTLGTFNKYEYDDEGGEDVTSYIIDTGVYVDHEDFEGRAVWGKTIPVGDVDEDAHGHGSHCAGTIGGKTYGVAKKAKLVGVKVLGSDGSGSMSDVIGGVEYAVQSHKAEQKKNPKHKGSTANMSLGGGRSPSLDIAVNAAVDAGVHFAVAAGNENQDACNSSPAGASKPVTVGATTLRDERAYFSNYGKCVDIFAPGVNILSVGTSSPDSTAIMSGTSMATPHIVGLLTYFLSLQPSADSEYSSMGVITPEELKKSLIDFGTPDILTDIDDASPNVLAYNGGGKDISDMWTRNPAVTAGEDVDSKWEDKLSILTHEALSEFGVLANAGANLVSDINELIHEAF